MIQHPQPGERFRAKHWSRKELEIQSVLVYAHDDARIPLDGHRDSWLVVATDGTKWTLMVNPHDDGLPWFGKPLRTPE